MKQAASIKGLQLEGLLPVSRSTPARLIRSDQQLQLMKFKAVRWVLFGDVVSGEVGGEDAS